jgi:hypothetical protein
MSRRRTWWLLGLAAVLFATGVGLGQTRAVLEFRRPDVTESLTLGERTVVDGVAYRLTRFTAAPQLPLRPDLRSIRDRAEVSALPGAELVQVILTVERVDPGRNPDTLFCDLSLQDSAGRRWSADGTVGYEVAGPAAITCGGADPEKPPAVGVPFEMGQVFQLPADAVDDVTVRVQLSGGRGRYLLELHPS